MRSVVRYIEISGTQSNTGSMIHVCVCVCVCVHIYTHELIKTRSYPICTKLLILVLIKFEAW